MLRPWGPGLGTQLPYAERCSWLETQEDSLSPTALVRVKSRWQVDSQRCLLSVASAYGALDQVRFVGMQAYSCKCVPDGKACSAKILPEAGPKEGTHTRRADCHAQGQGEVSILLVDPAWPCVCLAVRCELVIVTDSFGCRSLCALHQRDREDPTLVIATPHTPPGRRHGSSAYVHDRYVPMVACRLLGLAYPCRHF